MRITHICRPKIISRVTARRFKPNAVLLLLTLTENDPEARVWHTAGDFKAYAEVPYEYLEGKVSAFCLPHMGFVADDWLVLLPIFAGGAALFYAFSRVLPKKLYQPKYGRKPGEEAENGADT